jgi:hypothetical protein
MALDTTQEAYWISPKGIITPVDNSHIGTILHYPMHFGYTYDQVISVYKRHHEKIGFEGFAREEIMNDLFKKGWVRVRRKFNESCYVIQTDVLTDEIKNYIRKFSCEMHKDKSISGYSVILKTTANTEETTFYSLSTEFPAIRTHNLEYRTLDQIVSGRED